LGLPVNRSAASHCLSLLLGDVDAGTPAAALTLTAVPNVTLPMLSMVTCTTKGSSRPMMRPRNVQKSRPWLS
jgi:hypothetical protein